MSGVRFYVARSVAPETATDARAGAAAGTTRNNRELFMAIFFWSDNLSVGNRFIDKDHRRLIALLNTVYDAMNQGKGPDVVGEVLDELVQYTQKHFKREEKVMQTIHYAGYAEHKEEHDKLTAKALDMQRKFVSGETKLSVDLLQFLFDWLFDHILKIDTKLAQAIREADEDAEPEAM